MKTTFGNYSRLGALLSITLLAFPLSLQAQGNGVVTVVPPRTMPAKRGETAETRVGVRLQSGFHVNSNTPNEAYLIPLRLTWDAGALDAVQVVYPKSEQRNYQFSQKPVSVFTGDFDIVTRFKVTPGAPSGPGVLKGKLRYQACNNSSCLPPRTLDLRLSYSIQ